LILVLFARDKNKNEDEGDNKEIKPISISYHTIISMMIKHQKFVIFYSDQYYTLFGIDLIQSQFVRRRHRTF
jgi:hypothetical protein